MISFLFIYLFVHHFFCWCHQINERDLLSDLKYSLCIFDTSAICIALMPEFWEFILKIAVAQWWCIIWYLKQCKKSFEDFVDSGPTQPPLLSANKAQVVSV